MSDRFRPPEGNLSQDAFDFYAMMGFHASGAGKMLTQGWKRPKRHNKRIERAALWHSIGLGQLCTKALHPSYVSLLSPPLTDTETKYELEAGIRTVNAVLPFTSLERDALRREQRERNTRFDDENAIREVALFERWHEWLWIGERGEPQTSVEALGASAILAEGCGRLSDVVAVIVDEEVSKRASG